MYKLKLTTKITGYTLTLYIKFLGIYWPWQQVKSINRNLIQVHFEEWVRRYKITNSNTIRIHK